MTKTNRLRARVGVIAATTTLLLLGAVAPAIASRTSVEAEQTTGQTLLPEDHTGDAPLPEDHTGDAPLPEDHTGDAPLPEDHTGETPLPEESTDQAAEGPAEQAPHSEGSAEETPLPEGSNEHYAGSQIMKHEGRSGSPDPSAAQSGQTHGMDVSGWQGNVDWDKAWANGAKFAYVKATEGTGFKNPDFTQQYNGSYRVGMIRGAYHFALPDRSTGAAQAKYFVANGGGWSKDGRTLPPALDIEYNPYGATCYGLSQSQMVSWIRDFSNEVHRLTTRYPTIYTSTSWWQTCTGNNGGFGATNPLWIARYSNSVGTLPNGWGFHTIWQYSDSGIFPGDQNWFNGAQDRLQALANG